jgi:hypothetical protein
VQARVPTVLSVRVEIVFLDLAACRDRSRQVLGAAIGSLSSKV